MVDNEPTGIALNTNAVLPPLPFTYIKTDDRSRAQIRDVGALFQAENEPQRVRTEEEILAGVRRKKEGQNWYTDEYWRKKGTPQEQIDIYLNGRTITVYNYNKETPFTDEHLARAIGVFQKIAASFPQILDKIQWVLIDDMAEPSLFGDPEKYPANGKFMEQQKAFKMYPRGMSFAPHRISAVSNFEGTLGHELAHSLEGEFKVEWNKMC
ncbi:hypothetical protein HY214_03925 [Candidatus Roizmanbacteria bacterium]|nr:hypothetical protein [Candidatus Roizmanbacteria bacterium]